MQVRKACRLEDELEPGTCAVMCDFVSDGKKSPCGEVPRLGPPWGGSRLLSGSERVRLRAGGQVGLARLPALAARPTRLRIRRPRPRPLSENRCDSLAGSAGRWLYRTGSRVPNSPGGTAAIG